jgi:hypothetical protein
MYKLPFTLVNGFVEYRWLRGFNPILKHIYKVANSINLISYIPQNVYHFECLIFTSIVKMPNSKSPFCKGWTF